MDWYDEDEEKKAREQDDFYRKKTRGYEADIHSDAKTAKKYKVRYLCICDGLIGLDELTGDLQKIIKILEEEGLDIEQQDNSEFIEALRGSATRINKENPYEMDDEEHMRYDDLYYRWRDSYGTVFSYNEALYGENDPDLIYGNEIDYYFDDGLTPKYFWSDFDYSAESSYYSARGSADEYSYLSVKWQKESDMMALKDYCIKSNLTRVVMEPEKLEEIIRMLQEKGRDVPKVNISELVSNIKKQLYIEEEQHVKTNERVESSELSQIHSVEEIGKAVEDITIKQFKEGLREITEIDKDKGIIR